MRKEELLKLTVRELKKIHQDLYGFTPSSFKKSDYVHHIVMMETTKKIWDHMIDG